MLYVVVMKRIGLQLGLPIIFSWIVGALFAGGLAFVIGKVALGLRADYLAIATLLISEIVIAIIKHEDWLTRGVKKKELEECSLCMLILEKKLEI